MNVIIFYEHLTREWKAAQRLKERFQLAGISVNIYSIIYERTIANFVALKYKPDIIFVPWFVDGTHEKILQPFIQLNPKVKVVNLHQEQISSPACEQCLYPKTEYTKNGSFHFVWGEYFKQRLIENGVNQDKIFVTGNIRNDEIYAVSLKRKDLAQKFHLNSKKKWILFAENRGWLIQQNSEGAWKELKSRGMSCESIKEAMEYTKNSLTAFILEMQHLDEGFDKTFELIYRPHPGTMFTEVVSKCVHIINDESIYTWLNNVDLFLTCESTSIFEAELCGVPCARIDLVNEPETLKMPGVHQYPVVEHLNQINDKTIETLQKNQRHSTPIWNSYLGNADGNAVQRTVDYAMKLKCENNIIGISKLSMYERTRQMIYELVVYITDKTGLLYTLKTPKSAYGESRDIPFSKKNNWIYED